MTTVSSLKVMIEDAAKHQEIVRINTKGKITKHKRLPFQDVATKEKYKFTYGVLNNAMTRLMGLNSLREDAEGAVNKTALILYKKFKEEFDAFPDETKKELWRFVDIYACDTLFCLDKSVMISHLDRYLNQGQLKAVGNDFYRAIANGGLHVCNSSGKQVNLDERDQGQELTREDIEENIEHRELLCCRAKAIFKELALMFNLDDSLAREFIAAGENLSADPDDLRDRLRKLDSNVLFCKTIGRVLHASSQEVMQRVASILGAFLQMDKLPKKQSDTVIDLTVKRMKKGRIGIHHKIQFVCAPVKYYITDRRNPRKIEGPLHILTRVSIEIDPEDPQGKFKDIILTFEINRGNGCNEHLSDNEKMLMNMEFLTAGLFPRTTVSMMKQRSQKQLKYKEVITIEASPQLEEAAIPKKDAETDFDDRMFQNAKRPSRKQMQTIGAVVRGRSNSVFSPSTTPL